MKKFEQRPLASKHQRGMVLLVTLLVLALMTLASIGIMRSVDTSVAVVGNIALRQTADAATSTSMECVLRDMSLWGANPALLYNDNGVLGTGACGSCANYFATIQPLESAQGVPVLLQTRVNTCASQVTVERMCNTPGPPSAVNCLRQPVENDDDPQQGNYFNRFDNEAGSTRVYYRVSVRENGPLNTTSFAQTIIGL